MPITIIFTLVRHWTDRDHDQRSNQMELCCVSRGSSLLHRDNDDDETYTLLLFTNSNPRPTGSFVASAGLESHVTHGFLPKYLSTIGFVPDSLASYAHPALPFVSDAHRCNYIP